MAAAHVAHDIDRYEIITPLGQGGFGAVYLARHRMTGREVALKVSDPHGDPELVARALNEARIAATTRHPSLVDVYDCGSLPDGRIFVAMERVEGRSLESILESEGRITAERAIMMATQVLSALEVVHARGVIHRDIKPSNLLVRREPDGSERVFIIDFGISKVLHPSSTTAQPATMAGAILGTPGYMPPEQLDARSVDARADLYAVGAVLFRALSGRVLFDANTLAEWFVQITQAPTPPLASLAPWLSPQLCAAIDRSVARDRDARPPTARAMIEWLHAAMNGAADPASPASTARLPSQPTPAPAPALPYPSQAPSQPGSSGVHPAAAVGALAATAHSYAPAAPAMPAPASQPAAISYAHTAYAPSASIPAAPRSASSVAPAQLSPEQAATNRRAGAIVAIVAIATTGALLAIAKPWESPPPDDISTVTAMAPTHPVAAAATNALNAQSAPMPVALPQPSTTPTANPQPPAQSPAQNPAPNPTAATAQPSTAPNTLAGMLAAVAPAAREEQGSSDVALLRSPSGRLRFVQARPVGPVDMPEAIDLVRRAMPAIESCHSGTGAARASITIMFRTTAAPVFSQPASSGGALARCVEIAMQTSNTGLNNGTRSGGILADAEFVWR